MFDENWSIVSCPTFSNSSSLITAKSMCRGLIRVRWLSRAALPLNSSTSARETEQPVAMSGMTTSREAYRQDILPLLPDRSMQLSSRVSSTFALSSDNDASERRERWFRLVMIATGASFSLQLLQVQSVPLSWQWEKNKWNDSDVLFERVSNRRERPCCGLFLSTVIAQPSCNSHLRSNESDRVNICQSEVTSHCLSSKITGDIPSRQLFVCLVQDNLHFIIETSHEEKKRK